eukprot:Tbor_TRINITY_DN6358_c0_g1::TRINITY_DN6358_c0_g1_i1::g.17820::m.17820
MDQLNDEVCSTLLRTERNRLAANQLSLKQNNETTPSLLAPFSSPFSFTHHTMVMSDARAQIQAEATSLSTTQNSKGVSTSSLSSIQSGVVRFYPNVTDRTKDEIGSAICPLDLPSYHCEHWITRNH